jgi:hypothetical protein
MFYSYKVDSDFNRRHLEQHIPYTKANTIVYVVVGTLLEHIVLRL